MKVSQILLCIFLSVGINTSYSSEFMDDGTYSNFLNPQLTNLGLLGYEQIPVNYIEVQKILRELQKKEPIAEVMGSSSVTSTPSRVIRRSAVRRSPVTRRPAVPSNAVCYSAVMQEQIDAAIQNIVDNQSINIDSRLRYGVTNCEYCETGFCEHGAKEDIVRKIKEALTMHYNRYHRSNIANDKIYKN